jgi:D-alanine-D-alanine ligase-like ATP-grasp enzyme
VVTELDFDLLVNRMSPSSYTRGHGNALFYTQAYLNYVESLGIPVVNGSRAFALEISKAQQLVLMERLGVPYPKARVINHVDQAVAAADGLQFPVVTKANVGGSGAGITLFENEEELAAAAEAGLIDMGVDGTALVQEFLTPADGYIVRVEFLDGEYLYAIKVESNPADGFNLCPADVCEIPESAEILPATNGSGALDADFCPLEAPAKRDVQAYRPPPEIIEQVLRMANAGNLDIGGIEYLVSARDGQPYFYDINALSNFVANAPLLIGFDPFVNFADYLIRRARSARESTPVLQTAG